MILSKQLETVTEKDEQMAAEQIARTLSKSWK